MDVMLRITDGEVIVVCRDGWPWTPLEREHPEWRILHVPDLTEADAVQLQARERPVLPEDMRKPMRSRWYCVDMVALDALPADLTISRARLMAAVTLKPPVDDAFALGAPAAVFG